MHAASACRTSKATVKQPGTVAERPWGAKQRVRHCCSMRARREREGGPDLGSERDRDGTGPPLLSTRDGEKEAGGVTSGGKLGFIHYIC